MRAIAITAHHDDAVLWCGGAILRTQKLGWQWIVVALCVPDPLKQAYFDSYCAAIGVVGHRFTFRDYQYAQPFSQNAEADYLAAITSVLDQAPYDLVFTHSRDQGGEYGGHANHDEVLRVTQQVSPPNQLIHFCYSPEYGYGGRATTAKRDADFHLQLNYDELIQKAEWCRKAPDSMTSLKALGFPCPNLEGFRTEIKLSAPFLPRA